MLRFQLLLHRQVFFGLLLLLLMGPAINLDHASTSMSEPTPIRDTSSATTGQYKRLEENVIFTGDIIDIKTQHGETSNISLLQHDGEFDIASFCFLQSIMNIAQPQDERTRSGFSTAMDYLGVASSFTQMLIKRIPDVVDGNPVKMAFGIAKLALEIKDVRGHMFCSRYWPHMSFQLVTDNIDAVEQNIISTAAEVVMIKEELSSWRPSNSEETQRMRAFEQ